MTRRRNPVNLVSEPSPPPAESAPRTALPRGLLGFSLLTVTLWGISEAKPLLVPLTISGVLAFQLMPAIRLARRLRVPEWLSLVLATLTLILPIAVAAYFLVHQIQALLRDLPAVVTNIREMLVRINASELGTKLNLATYLDPDQLSTRFEGQLGRGFGLVMTGITTVLGAGTQLLLVLLFTLLMIASRGHLRKSAEAIIAVNSRVSPKSLLDEICSLIERFLTMRLVIVLIIATIDTGIIAAFGLSYAFLQGTLLGIMTLVPAIGFLIGAVPPMLLAIGAGFSAWRAIGLFACLLFMSAVEGNVLTPKLVGNRLNINTLSTFVGIFAGALLWGPWGMFLSIPVMGVMRVCFSVSPRLAPWGELLAERADPTLVGRLHARSLHRQRRHWTL
jgi:putative permease